MRSPLAVSCLVLLVSCNWEFFPSLAGPSFLDIPARSISIPEGQSRPIPVYIDHCEQVPNDCIRWTSSNSCVAWVMGRQAMGWRAGEAVAHAWVTQAGLHDSIVVTVAPVAAVSLRFDSNSVSVALDRQAMVTVRALDALERPLRRPTALMSADTTVAVIRPVNDECTPASTLYVHILPVSRGSTTITAQLGSLADTVRITVF